MIVFYLINLAGAGNPGGTLADVQSGGNRLSGSVGQVTGKGASKISSKFLAGIGEGIKNGWNKMRGKK